MTTIDYNDVALFVRVVETGSFTKAAEALGLQKSSVSRAVSRLEDGLGARLLQRTTRRLGLTDAGQLFYERARGAVAGVDEAASLVLDSGSEPRGLVRLTAPPDAHALGLAEGVAQFVARYPAIQVDLVLTGRVVDLVTDGVDLAVRAGRLADSTLVARRVGSTDLALFAAASYLDRRGRPASPTALAPHDCVLFRARGGRATWNLVGPDGEEVVEVQGPISADDFAFVARAAIAGAGIALLPVTVAADAVRRGELESLLHLYRVAGGPLHVVLPSSIFVPSRVALLRDFLVEFLTAKLAAVQEQCAEHRAKVAPPPREPTPRPSGTAELARAGGSPRTASRARGAVRPPRPSPRSRPARPSEIPRSGSPRARG